MRAAVVRSFDAPPRYEELPDPVATGEGELVVDVVGAALHPRIRSQANGSHYTSTGRLPLVPGIDAVVRDPQGRLRYALLDDTTLGTLAERTVVDRNRTVPLPDDVDAMAVAAAMNPAMSSWVALRRRIELPPAAQVLVLGATGSAGRLAVQVARRFGAATVIGAGRDAGRLAELSILGADFTPTLDRLEPAADVDVVLDYVWGEPAASAMAQLITHRADRGKPLTWVQIGSMAGPTSPIPSAALRAARLQVVGSGIGSVSAQDFRAELEEIAAAVTAGELDVTPRAVPLAHVEAAWNEPTAPGERIVFVP